MKPNGRVRPLVDDISHCNRLVHFSNALDIRLETFLRSINHFHPPNMTQVLSEKGSGSSVARELRQLCVSGSTAGWARRPSNQPPPSSRRVSCAAFTDPVKSSSRRDQWTRPSHLRKRRLGRSRRRFRHTHTHTHTPPCLRPTPSDTCVSFRPGCGQNTSFRQEEMMEGESS